MGHIAEALKKARQERGAGIGCSPTPLHDALPASSLPMREIGTGRIGGLAAVPGRAAVAVQGLRGARPAAGEAPRTGDSERVSALDSLHPAEAFGDVRWDVDAGVVSAIDRTGPITEQYRAVRTWLLARVRPNERTALAVTSSMPREGKTVTAANLAVVMAEIRRMRVLLVDCDLRRGELAGLLRLRVAPGLADVLSGRLGLDEAIVPTPLPNLWVLPAGDLAGANPTELFNSVAASRAFDEIRERYHYSVVDTPPVHRVSDIGVIGALCTGIVMVVRMRRTPMGVVRQSLQWLQANNLHVLGTIAAGCGQRDAGGDDREEDEG